MKLETFYNHFDLLADAPNAVQKMRELVLGLAVQGKLVEQDPRDEPASVLLERIEAEKHRLIEEKKTRKQKPLPPASEEEYRHELPTGWDISRLGEITDIIRGVTFPASEKSKKASADTIACLRTANVQSSVEWDDLIYIPLKRVKRSDQRVQKDDIVISMANSYELVGKVAQVSEVPEEATFGGFLSVIRTIQTDPGYMMCFLRSPEVQAEMRSTSSQTTNIANISLTGIRPILVPIPPLEEQKRIVAKVDELMALLDGLEAQQEARNRARKRLNTAALGELLGAQDEDTFGRHWRRVQDNFGVLMDTPENVAELRKAVLQLAVRGKLVPQDPRDEPVERLLERIEAEKARLFEEKKIKKPKKLQPIDLDDVTPNIPETWAWTRLGGLVESMNNGLYKPSTFYSNDGVGSLRMFNIQDGKTNLEGLKRLEITTDELEQYRLLRGDLVVNRVNSRELVGKAALIEDLSEPLVYEAMNIRVRLLVKEHLPAYINLLFRTAEVRVLFQGDAKQASGQASVSQPQVANVPVPLPPLNEQKRIVAKVDELMELIDRLEEGLTQARGDAERLLDAVVHRLQAA